MRPEEQNISTLSKNVTRSVRGSLDLTLYTSLVNFTITISLEFCEGELVVQEKIRRETRVSKYT